MVSLLKSHHFLQQDLNFLRRQLALQQLNQMQELLAKFQVNKMLKLLGKLYLLLRQNKLSYKLILDSQNSSNFTR
jgi:hypothetical protein